MNIFKLVILSVVLCGSSYVFAAESENQSEQSSREGATTPVKTGFSVGIIAGVTNNFIVDFQITDKGGDTEYANFTGRSTVPLLLFSTTDLINRSTGWGLIIEAGYSDFDLNKQERDEIEYNFGTSVEGKYYYIMPVLFYSTSEKVADPANERGLRLGAGVGMAYLEANGTAVYTNPGSDRSVIHTIQVAEMGPMAKLLVEYRHRGFVAGMHMKIPVVTGQDETGNDRAYLVGEFGVNLAYSLYF